MGLEILRVVGRDTLKLRQWAGRLNGQADIKARRRAASKAAGCTARVSLARKEMG